MINIIMNKNEALNLSKAHWEELSKDYFYRWFINQIPFPFAHKVNPRAMKIAAIRFTTNPEYIGGLFTNNCPICEWAYTETQHRSNGQAKEIDCSICPISKQTLFCEGENSPYMKWVSVISRIREEHTHNTLPPFSTLFTEAAYYAQEMYNICNTAEDNNNV